MILNSTKIEKIEDSTPREMAEENMKLADALEKAGRRVVELEEQYDIWFNINRKDYKSDTATDRAWGLTENGKELRLLKMGIKTGERQIQTRRDYLRVRDNETVYNKY